MKIYKVQDFVVKGKEVFVGLEDSKSTWKIAVRSERMLIHAVRSGSRPLDHGEIHRNFLRPREGDH